MKECLICKWMREKENVVCYIGNAAIIISELSYVKYHMLICPKKHYESIFEMPKKEYNELFDAMRRVGELLENRLGADATRYALNNNHLKVSKSKLHLNHIHLQVFPCFGELTDITGKYRKKLSPREIEEMKKEILKHVPKG